MVTMSNKKDNDKEKKEEEKNLEEKIEKLEKEVNNLKEEVTKKNDKLLRSYADLQNFKKRMKRDLASKEKETKQKYISKIIDLKELLKQAYEDENPKEGMKYILNDLNQYLDQENVEYIECVGEKFDHNCHHAVSTVEKENCENGEIVEEIKKGYKIDDEILRPSHVIVAKKEEKKNNNEE